ncbi:MAG TPA: tRNA 2-selenouridine(34) synthase MnmH [Chitinophagaceae bacterium]|nr:tRNA 2-selenouridine(34) synthase MnmH [Chitinophagaceae bacterium]
MAQYKSISIADALVMQQKGIPLIDVRTPAEYLHAHVPLAVNVPIFSNEQRAHIGTLYKKTSRQAAVEAGLQYFAPNMLSLLATIKSITPMDSPVIVYCWRGGLRSGTMAWLLHLYGYEVYQLTGGYKAFRNWVLAQQHLPQGNFNVLAGNTGSGKTTLLQTLAQSFDQPVLDLEQLANHRGSSFGQLGMPPQPSQEQFENLLAFHIHKLQVQYPNQPIWVEDENQRVGNVFIPLAWYQYLHQQPTFVLQVAKEQRLQNIVQDYGIFEATALIDGVMRIEKRLGGMLAKTIVTHLINRNYTEAFDLLLDYYDRYYEKDLHKHVRPQIPVTITNDNLTVNAIQLLAQATAYYGNNQQQ